MRTSPLRAFASDNKKKKESEKKNKKVSMQDPDSGGLCTHLIKYKEI